MRAVLVARQLVRPRAAVPALARTGEPGLALIHRPTRLFSDGGHAKPGSGPSRNSGSGSRRADAGNGAKAGAAGGRHKRVGDDGSASARSSAPRSDGAGGSMGDQGSWAFGERAGRVVDMETSTTQRLQERLHVLGDVINARSHHQREELQRLFKQILDARSRRLAAAVGSLLLVVGSVVFFNRHRAREVVKDELSHAASGALGDEKMQMQATALTLQTLQALLEDPGTQRRSVDFICALADHPATRAALVSLLVTALKDPAVLREALELTLWVLDREDTRQHFIGALVAALRSEEFLAAAGVFAAAWFAREDTREAASELLRSSSMSVLENEEVRGNARQLVSALLEQPHLQAKTGEHLWAAMKGGILGLGFPKPKPQPQSPSQPSVPQIASSSHAPMKAGAADSNGGLTKLPLDGSPSPLITGVTVEANGNKTDAATTRATNGATTVRDHSESRGHLIDKQDVGEGAESAPRSAEGEQPLAHEFALVRRVSASRRLNDLGGNIDGAPASTQQMLSAAQRASMSKSVEAASS